MGKLRRTINVRGIILSIWDNEAIVKGEATTIPNIVIKRAYLDNNKKWQYTANFRESDLASIKEVIEKYERGE